MRFHIRRVSALLFCLTIAIIVFLRMESMRLRYRRSNGVVNTVQNTDARTDRVVNRTSPTVPTDALLTTSLPVTASQRSTLTPSYRQQRFGTSTRQQPANFSPDSNELYRQRFVIRHHKSGNDNESIWWWNSTSTNQENTGDRILQQINHVPRSYRLRVEEGNNAASLKTIYVPGGAANIQGQVAFIRGRCLVDACSISADPRDANSSHLRVLSSGSVPFLPSHLVKPPGQIWVMYLLESPASTAEFYGMADLINWTATFRRDSTIVTPYAKFVPFRNQSAPSPSVSAAKNFAAAKTKMVAWFVSNCNARNERGPYVEELSRFVPVDVFGICGRHSCSRTDHNCWLRLRRDYKFYLSFENSNCDNYISEKFFDNALSNDVVPIVMGGRRQDYERSSPPHSYIHVEDFTSASDLADYILLLNQSDVLYNEYFQWRGTGEFVNTKFWCRLCAMLHDDDKPVMWYSDFNQWWSHPGTCRTQQWNSKTTYKT